MANLSISKGKTQAQIKPKRGVPLDTLAQLRIDTPDGRQKFIKRQKAKAITLAQLFPLINLNSRLKKSYWRAYHCNRLIHQEGYKMTTNYCNCRWCTVCNRIRMAKMINGYSLPLLEFTDLYFVTLTTPNVEGYKLSQEIDDMYKSWRAINDNMRKTYGLNIKGIRKLECTYNPITNTYNPHFHFLIDGKASAQKLIKLWLQRYPSASHKAQDMRKAKDGTLIELFKYAVKGVHKGKYYPEALDQIYQALEGRRTYQPFGISKNVSEDIDGIKAQEIRFRGYADNQWTWSKEVKDWVNQDGELLTEYIIEGDLADWIESLIVDDEPIEQCHNNPKYAHNKPKFRASLIQYYCELEEYSINSS